MYTCVVCKSKISLFSKSHSIKSNDEDFYDCYPELVDKKESVQEACKDCYGEYLLKLKSTQKNNEQDKKDLSENTNIIENNEKLLSDEGNEQTNNGGKSKDQGNLIDCPDCHGTMAKSAKSCPHCGSTSYQKAEAERDSEKATKGCLIGCGGILLFFLIVLLLGGINNSRNSTSTRSTYSEPKSYTPTKDCYELGYRYGRAAARAAKGLDPGSDGNLTIPYRCQDDPVVDSGLTDGAASVW